MHFSFVEQDVIQEMKTNDGTNILDLSFRQPVMLVFLRHFGCTFCREALADIAAQKQELESKGARIVFVHMSEDKVAEEFFTKFGLPGIPHISDRECRFYKAFGLGKGTFTQLFGLSTWIRGFDAGFIRGHGIEFGAHLGDSFQMPGVFILQDGTIKESYIHKLASDRPDYEELAKCCGVPSKST